MFCIMPLLYSSAPCGLIQTLKRNTAVDQGVVVNFDLGERFLRPRSQQRGSNGRVAVLGVGAGGGRPLPLGGSGGMTPGIFF